ncbi:MAG: glycosyltransferase family 39 protein [Elusimicrobia bacterium]|nr:glycosyltransferase family 39 protein [Elusimicrobiota bacterium]MDE2313780.1 glycosyltransferase family 39 protein [Elusimicrobiota bacterium]
MNARAARLCELVSVLFSWGLFLALLRRIWPYQGVFTGETQGGAAAYAWVHQIPNMFHGPSASIFGWNVPVMYNFFHGPWGIYLLAPFVALGGCTLAALRSYSAFMFLLALWGTWRLAFLATKSRMAALLSAILLAVCPAMAVTRSEFVSAPDVAASVWALCFALSYVRTRKPAHAWAACAAFSLGFCTRAWVAGLGAGLLLYAALAWRHIPALLPQSAAARRRLAAGCAAAAGFFLLPILAYNAAHGWVSVVFYAHDSVWRNTEFCGAPGQAACSNLAYWTNAKFNLDLLKSMCDGTGYILAREPWHRLYAALLLVSLGATLRDSWRRRTLWGSWAALWIIALGYFLISAVSPTTETISHLTALLPILAVLSVSWLAAVPVGRPRAAAAAALAAACAAQFFGTLRLFRKENVDVSAHGWYEMSPLVIEASRWAGAEARIPIISLSQPFTDAAPYFSQGRAVLVSWPEWMPAGYRIPWRQWLLRKDRPYFLTENDGTGASAAARLHAEAKALGLRLTRAETFRDPAGRPAFVAYRVDGSASK